MEVRLPVRTVFGFLLLPIEEEVSCSLPWDIDKVWICSLFALIRVCVFVAQFILSHSPSSSTTMGKTPSTPLDLTLAHWHDLKDTANNNRVLIQKHKWVTFCSVDWHLLNVQWQGVGTFGLETMDRVAQMVSCPVPVILTRSLH